MVDVGSVVVQLRVACSFGAALVQLVVTRVSLVQRWFSFGSDLVQLWFIVGSDGSRLILYG